MKIKKQLTTLIILISLFIFQGCMMTFTFIKAMESYKDEKTVFVVFEGIYYHKVSCKEIKKKQKTGLPRREAIDQGYTPCPVCDPDN